MSQIESDVIDPITADTPRSFHASMLRDSLIPGQKSASGKFVTGNRVLLDPGLLETEGSLAFLASRRSCPKSPSPLALQIFESMRSPESFLGSPKTGVWGQLDRSIGCRHDYLRRQFRPFPKECKSGGMIIPSSGARYEMTCWARFSRMLCPKSGRWLSVPTIRRASSL
jgi:hypothetical protein